MAPGALCGSQRQHGHRVEHICLISASIPCPGCGFLPSWDLPAAPWGHSEPFPSGSCLSPTPEQEEFVSAASALLRQHHDLFLQCLWWEEDPPHDGVQLLQRQLGVQHRRAVRLGRCHVLQQAVEIPENIP